MAYFQLKVWPWFSVELFTFQLKFNRIHIFSNVITEVKPKIMLTCLLNINFCFVSRTCEDVQIYLTYRKYSPKVLGVEILDVWVMYEP
mmetsp:Transcript_18825/g.46163  ORF Transcript_18825/g.46163 Transcript_18825/m.46163 type:complete len:88 (-) Transcript_18825:909-1172(-)